MAGDSTSSLLCIPVQPGREIHWHRTSYLKENFESLLLPQTRFNVVLPYLMV